MTIRATCRICKEKGSVHQRWVKNGRSEKRYLYYYVAHYQKGKRPLFHYYGKEAPKHRAPPKARARLPNRESGDYAISQGPKIPPSRPPSGKEALMMDSVRRARYERDSLPVPKTLEQAIRLVKKRRGQDDKA